MKHKLLVTALLGLCVFTGAYVLLTAESLNKKDSLRQNIRSESETTSSLDDLMASLRCNENVVGGRLEARIADYLSEETIIERSRSSCEVYFESISKLLTYDPSSESSGCDVRGKNFPLAFSISTHQQIGILEVFLALFFRPCDSYCIHMDAKAPTEVKKALDAVVNCYRTLGGSVFVHPNPVSVVWGAYSVLETDILCMQELIKKVPVHYIK